MSDGKFALSLPLFVQWITLSTSLTLLFSNQSLACTQGELSWDGTDLKYCKNDGTTWVKVQGTSLGGTCTNGTIGWNGSDRLRMCSGGAWYDMSVEAVSGTCSGNAATAGQFYYDSTLQNYVYCASTGMKQFSPKCAGVLVGGYCWYLSANGGNCTTTCSTHGGYNDATLNYAGSSGSHANCEAVLDHLGAPGSGTTGISTSYAIGCHSVTSNTDRRREVNAATTEGATRTGRKRACACNE